MSAKLDYSKIEDVKIDGVNTNDYPDFCDAYISAASYEGRELNEDELCDLNQDTQFVYEKVWEHLYG